MTKESDAEVGNIGEQAACEYLTNHGFSVLARNFKRKVGEIDIVAGKGMVIHFVEVKTSRHFPGTAFLPEIRVNRKKIDRLKRTCQIYLAEIKAPDDQRWQIDIISAILAENGEIMSISHIESAVFEKKY